MPIIEAETLSKVAKSTRQAEVERLRRIDPSDASPIDAEVVAVSANGLAEVVAVPANVLPAIGVELKISLQRELNAVPGSRSWQVRLPFPLAALIVTVVEIRRPVMTAIRRFRIRIAQATHRPN